MRKVIYLMVFVVGVCLITYLIGCDTNVTKTEEFEKILPRKLASNEQICSQENLMPLPKGTEVFKAGEKIRIQLPEGYYFKGNLKAQPDDEIIFAAPPEIKCDCTNPENGQCTPYFITMDGKDYYGCITTSDNHCEKCEMTASEGTSAYKTSEFNLEIMLGNPKILEQKLSQMDEDEKMGLAFAFMAISESPIQSVYSYTQMHHMQPVEEADLQDAKVRSILKNYETQELENGKLPMGTALVPLDIKGKLGYVVVDEKLVDGLFIQKIPSTKAEEAAPYCTGSCGTVKCELKKILVPIPGTSYLYSCRGCWDGCTLHM